jgi:lysozyme family protein
MQQNRDKCISKILISEGGTYTDGVHPYDPGGPTKWGITIADVRMYIKPGATAADVKNLTMAQAVGVYIRIYWARVRGDDLLSGVDYTVVDYGVNSGTGRAAKVLQAVLGIARDGRIGPATLAALALRDPDSVIDAINDERMLFLQSLRIWPTYKNGWSRRVREVRADSHSLAANQPVAAKPSSDADAVPVMAKAVVPAPKAPKNIVAGSAASAGGASYSWWDWIMAHPIETTMLAAGATIIVIGIIVIIYRNHKRKAEEPHPLVQVVPPKVVEATP